MTTEIEEQKIMTEFEMEEQDENRLTDWVHQRRIILAKKVAQNGFYSPDQELMMRVKNIKIPDIDEIDELTEQFNSLYYDKRYFKYGPKNMEFCAAGVLFTKKYKGETIYLVFHNKNPEKKYDLEEFGGKSDTDDKDLIWTAARETSEEMNGIISTQEIWDLISYGMDVRRIMNPKFKYATYIIPWPKHLNVDDIGEYENDGNHHFKRKFMWMTKKQILNRNSNYTPICRLIYSMKNL
jgi:hypothetical protein